MKIIFVILITAFAVMSFGCEDILSEREKDSFEIGWINERDTLSTIPLSILSGSEIDTDISILWSDGCKYRSFFEVERESNFVYKFTLKDASKGQICTLDIRQTNTKFKFKPEQKGEYTLHFIDRNGTRTRKLTVY